MSDHVSPTSSAHHLAGEIQGSKRKSTKRKEQPNQGESNASEPGD